MAVYILNLPAMWSAKTAVAFGGWVLSQLSRTIVASISVMSSAFLLSSAPSVKTKLIIRVDESYRAS